MLDEAASLISNCNNELRISLCIPFLFVSIVEIDSLLKNKENNFSKRTCNFNIIVDVFHYIHIT